jgi:hypothetical protein
MPEIDARSRESARQLAENISSRLSDEERAKMLEMGHEIAEGALATFKDPLSALRACSTISYMFAGLSQLTVAEAGAVIRDYCRGYALGAGIVAGVFPAAATEPLPVPAEDEPERATDKFGQYL